MNSFFKTSGLLLALFFFSGICLAEVKLPSIFSDNMVLQQNSDAAIWGTAGRNKTIKIHTSWNNKNYTAKADAKGDWKLHVKTPKYGGPYTIRVSEDNTITLKNVLIGEVWLCSGQSNMEMPLAGWGKVNNYEQEIANAHFPEIRLLQAIHVTANQPQADLKVRNNGWDICSPATVADFSSTAYFFAREIYNQTKIPIGLIHSSWGGTVAEAWTSYETLSRMKDFAEAAKTIKFTPPMSKEELSTAEQNWEALALQKDPGYVAGSPVWHKPDLDVTGWKAMQLPGFWEEKGLRGFDGVVWFRKKISVPADWNGEDAVLRFYADDNDITWFNGEQIGAVNKWDQQRVYAIPARLLHQGDNYITIRVDDVRSNGGIHGNATEFTIQNKSGTKTIPLAGDWLYKIAYSLKDLPPKPQSQTGPNRAAVLYNAMINPVINYKIKGAIWYQGESNATRAFQYQTLFPAMIKDWRSKFPSGDFPFYFVQLANFMKRDEAPGASQWAELREAQFMTTSLPNTGMAVTIDIGDEKDIHPKNKQEVGRRLALIALNKIYGKQTGYSGPIYKNHVVKGNKIILSFLHDKGLKAAGGEAVKGFAIAGKNKRFYWADAKIEGNKIIVSSKNVADPVAVRYGWANNPDVNLYNSSNLPASPFRTDSWTESTEK